MNIFVIGSGGREHALLWKLAQSKRVKKIYCAPGNPGIAQLATCVSIETQNFASLRDFTKKHHVDLTIIGPEAPLLDGIVDAFETEGLAIVGPTRAAAQIEGSKIFAKNLMQKYGIPTAQFAAFTIAADALRYIRRQSFPLVVKADGPCLGKGVSVCQTKQEAEQFIGQLMNDQLFGPSGSRIVIEECLVGPEVSFMVATDGKDFVSFLPSQDHKRVYDGNRGPMTGGMGAYAPVPFVDAALTRRIEETIVMPTLEAMIKEGHVYRGILYSGLILTKDGLKVLEFNCRFGDPETQPLMMLLETDLLDILLATLPKNGKALRNRIRWIPGAAACVVLASKGYPGKYEKGVFIDGLPSLSDVVIFHAATKELNGSIVTDGGRVLGVTAFGKNLDTALKSVYAAIGKNGIHFPGMQYRKDIGRASLPEPRRTA